MSVSPEEMLLGFARALRASGVAVTLDRERAFLDAVSVVGFDDRRATHIAGRATLCSSPDDLARYGIVFEEWFGGAVRHAGANRPAQVQQVLRSDLLGEGSGEDEEHEAQVVRQAASATEILRHRDIAELSATERAYLAGLFGSLRRPFPCRRSPRHLPGHRGTIDAHRTLRAQLKRMGEPGELQWRRRGVRPRRVVLLIDVSGSMSSYAESLLRLAHHWVTGGAPVEVFTMGTRLTHITRALRERDPERALVAAGETVPDWSGGTRLGESLKAFLDRFGRRGTARGSVVVVCSDGWEREGVDLLGEQMRSLRRLAHRVVWVNPHAGKPGYEAVQQGIVAALPHCDAFLAGHSLQTFDKLAEVVGRA